jgi:hypothetical protein
MEGGSPKGIGRMHPVFPQSLPSNALCALSGHEHADWIWCDRGRVQTLVKQRLCRSGMRWTEKAAQVILSLRALLLTPALVTVLVKIDQYGVPELDRY